MSVLGRNSVSRAGKSCAAISALELAGIASGQVWGGIPFRIVSLFLGRIPFLELAGPVMRSLRWSLQASRQGRSGAEFRSRL